MVSPEWVRGIYGSSIPDFGLGILLHKKKKVGYRRSAHGKEFFCFVFRDPSESSMIVENLRIHWIVGAEQVAISFMSSRTHTFSSHQEADG